MSGHAPDDGSKDDGILTDATAALVAGGVVLLGWQSTYAGSGWWIAGLAASLLAVMVTVLIRDAGGGGEMVVLALLVGYLVVAGPLAGGAVAIDGWGTLTDGITGTGEVWHDLLTTHPPVDATGPALLPPILTGLVTSGLGASMAIGSRRPAAPLLPLVAAVAVVLLLGQHRSASVLGLGVGAGALSIVWLRLRALRNEEGHVGRDPARWTRIVAGTAVVAVCAAASLAVVGDDVEPGRYLLRDQVRPEAVAGLVTPLDDFRDLVLSDRRLLVVEGLPAGYRLRYAALDRYDGRTWSTDNDTDPARSDDRFLHVSSTVDNAATGDERAVTIETTQYWNRPWVPTVGAVQSFDFKSPDPDARSDLLYNPATQTALLPDGLDRDVRYSFKTIDTDRPADRRMRESTMFDRDLYVRLSKLDQVIRYWKAGAYTPMDALFEVAAGIRKVGRYSHGVEPWERAFTPGHDLRHLTEDFLLSVPSVGDEEQYAAAMALLAIRMRIPARVVVGAIVPRDGIVRGSDTTAWVEVRADDGTWRTLPTDFFMSRKPADRLDSSFPTSRDYDPPADVEPDIPGAEPERPADTRDTSDDTGSDGRRWLLLLLFPLVVVAAGGVPVAKWWRRRRRMRASRVSSRYAGAWEELIDRARDLGIEVPIGAARPVQAAVLAGTLPLALEADRRIYSGDELDAREADAFWQLVHAELRGLDAGTSRWRRVRAFFSPRSLRH